MDDSTDVIEEQEVTTEDTTLPADPAPAPEKTFSQADVDRIVKERLDRDRRARRAKQRKSKPEPTPDNAEPDPVDDGSWRDDFYDAIDGYKLSRGQRKRLRDSFRRERPDDPDAWVESWCDDFGISRDGEPGAPEPEPKADEPNANPEPQAKPVNRGPPSTGTDYDTVIDPNALSADDIARMYQKYGKRAAQRKIRTMAENWAKGRRVGR